MKYLLLTSLASVGLLALIGCADDTQTHVTQTHYSSTLSSDPKDMSSTTTEVPPAEAQTAVTNTSTTVNEGYPAIHSNGQGGGGM